MKLYCDCGQKIYSRLGVGKYVKRPEQGEVVIGLSWDENLYVASEETEDTVTRVSKVKVPMCKHCIEELDVPGASDFLTKFYPHIIAGKTVIGIERKLS